MSVSPDRNLALELAVHRPWYFYLLTLVVISPVYLLAGAAGWRRQPRDLAPALWFMSFWIAMTLFGLQGGGYQTRYLAPAYPALALLAAEPIPRLRSPGMMAVAALVGYGMMNALMYAVLDTPHLDDFQFSAAELLVRTFREIPAVQ